MGGEKRHCAIHIYNKERRQGLAKYVANWSIIKQLAKLKWGSGSRKTSYTFEQSVVEEEKMTSEG